MAVVYNDGSVLYGSRQITLSTAGAVIADSIEVTRPSNVIERTNYVGEPSGWVAVPGFVTGTASLQLASTVPVLGETFSTTFGASSETFVLVEVGQPEEKGSLKMVNVTFRKQIN